MKLLKQVSQAFDFTALSQKSIDQTLMTIPKVMVMSATLCIMEQLQIRPPFEGPDGMLLERNGKLTMLI